MRIRLAEDQDIDQLYALGLGVSEFEVSAETVEFWPKATLSAAVGSPDVAIAVAVDDGKVLGFAIANINPTLRKAMIENLFVSPDRRGKGIGGDIVRYLCDVVTAAYNCSYIATLVPPEAEGALQTYQQSGFVKGESFVWLDKAFGEFKR
jgi:ribosomal protein S18 acetylase RimI-like enzyme